MGAMPRHLRQGLKQTLEQITLSLACSSAFLFFFFFISFLLPVSLFNSLTVCCCSNPWIIWVTLFLSLCGYCLPSSVNSILPFHLLLLHFLIILKLPASLLVSPQLYSFFCPSPPSPSLILLPLPFTPFKCCLLFYPFLLQPWPHVLLLPLPLSSPVSWLSGPLVNPRSSVPDRSHWAIPTAIQTDWQTLFGWWVVI